MGTIQLHSNDVICGRGGKGGKAFEHFGNKNYRKLVQLSTVCSMLLVRLIYCLLTKNLLYQIYYTRVPKNIKRPIARTIVKTIKELNPPGRFVRKNAKSGMWYELRDVEAVEKILQALRESCQG